MKNLNFKTIALGCLTIFLLQGQATISQNLREVPHEIQEYSNMNFSDTADIPITQIYQAAYDALDNLDSTQVSEANKIQRWLRYTLSYYNVYDSTDYSLDAYNEVVRSIYSSSLNCGNNDLANWESLGPVGIPDFQFNSSQQHNGGWIDAIYNHPNNLDVYLIGTRTSGIFKTVDGGDTWDCVTDDLNFPVLGVKQLIAAPDNPDYILGITGTGKINGGIIYSDDAG